MIVSDNIHFLKRAKHLTTQAKADEANFIHDEVGYNYRMTNIQAALGIAQLEQIEEFIKIKTRNYEFYKEAIEQINGLSLLKFRYNTRPNYWFYSVYCEKGYPMDRDTVIQKLKKNGIQSRPIWGLISRQKPYEESREFQVSCALNYWKNVVNVPCSTNLSLEDIRTVISLL